jgi:HSP20 family protein
MLMRFDPFREIDRALRGTEQFFSQSPSVPFDAVRRGGHVVVRFDLPGVAPDAIDLTVERNVLTLNAERKFDRSEGEEFIAGERREGSFTRQLFLGDTLDASKVDASYENGVLTVTIPVAETAKPRKVSIGATNSDRHAIDADSRTEDEQVAS